jgi:hypothetical protein
VLGRFAGELTDRLASAGGWSSRPGCCYADHSHLVREFHRLAGSTPSEYLAG